MEQVNFQGLIMSIYAACWQQLGKIANPITGKIDRNLDHAKYSIEMLSMLKEKTKGNLTDEELKTLQEMIANLQMNYVDEAKKPQEGNKEEKAGTKSEKQ